MSRSFLFSPTESGGCIIYGPLSMELSLKGYMPRKKILSETSLFLQRPLQPLDVLWSKSPNSSLACLSPPSFKNCDLFYLISPLKNISPRPQKYSHFHLFYRSEPTSEILPDYSFPRLRRSRVENGSFEHVDKSHFASIFSRRRCDSTHF